MPIYIKADGLSGSVSAKSYENWIEVYSLHFDISSQTTMPVGQVNDRARGAPKFSELTISKKMDESSNGFFQHVVSEKVIPKVEIHVISSYSQLKPTVKYILQNVLVSHNENVAFGDDIPAEEIKLHFTKIETTYIGRDEKNRPKSPKIVGYNLETAEPM